MKSYRRTITSLAWAAILFMTILGGISWADDVEKLLNNLRSIDPLSREQAASALGGTKDPTFIKPLIETLADEYPYVRRAAAEALGKMGEQAVEPLLNAVKNESANVRVGALTALGLMRNPKAVRSSISLLPDKDVSVRDAAIRALGRINNPAGNVELMRLLGKESPELSTKAAYVLSDVGWTPEDPEARAAFLITTNQWEKVPELGEIAVKALIVALGHDDESGRLKAVEALGKIRAREAVDHLMVCLKDPSMGVRAKAAWALGQCRDKRSVASLVIALHDPVENVRESACLALQAMGWTPSQTMERVWFHLANHEWDKLVGLGGPSVEPLILGLTKGSSKVRRSAALALGKIKDARALDPLIAVLTDADANVRLSSARALGMIGDPCVAQKLIPCLTDDDWRVREAARISLKTVDRMGGERQHVTETNSLILSRIAATRNDEASAVIELRTELCATSEEESLDGKNSFIRSVCGAKEGLVGTGGTVEVKVTARRNPQWNPVPQTRPGRIMEGSYLLNPSLDISAAASFMSLGPTKWDGRNRGAVHRIQGKISACDYEFCSDPGNPLVFRVTQNGYRYVHGSGTVRDAKSDEIFIIKDESREALLRRAAAAGDKALAEKLIREGTNVNAQQRFGNSPLMIACRNGHPDLVRLFLEKGADVHTCDPASGRTPLMLAIKEGKAQLVSLLLANGADSSSVYRRTGRTALMEALVKKNTRIARLLVNRGADVNAKAEGNGATVLMYAVSEGNEDIVKTLLEKGADVNAKSKWGQTALSIGQRKNIPSIEKLLLQRGAK